MTRHVVITTLSLASKLVVMVVTRAVMVFGKRDNYMENSCAQRFNLANLVMTIFPLRSRLHLLANKRKV